MPHSSASRGLIVTADDSGLREAINEAVERAPGDGALTAASLLAGAPAADAVDRARRAPSLRVGLHIVLANGPAMPSRREIRDLIDAASRFGDAMARDGFRFFSLPRVRRQLAAEIRAQFALSHSTGLTMDRVNARKHFHVHPTALSLILSIGRRFRIREVRLRAEGKPPLAALLSPRVCAAIDSLNVRRGGFSDFWPVRGAA